MRTLTCLSLAALLAAGCGWESDGLARLEELYPTPEEPPVEPKPVDRCALPNDAEGSVAPGGTCDAGLASGRWAVRFVEYGSMKPMGSPWDLRLTDLFLAQPSADKKSVELTFCDQLSHLAQPSGTAVEMGKTKMSAKTREALGKTKLVLPLDANGAFSAQDVAWVWGAKGLANPATDAMPSKASDPLLWDEDQDGNPGVTVQVMNPAGYRFMARRSVFDFASGKASADGRYVTGTLTFAITENAVGATNALLLTVAPITARSECTNVYQLRCVDPGYTCDQLIADHTKLFRDAPK